MIGKFIAVGAENIVYFYNGDKEVIKFPTFFSLRYKWDKERYCNEIKNGFDTLKKYLAGHLNQSEIFFYENNKKYAIIEPLIKGKALTKEDLKNEQIKKQFLEIIKTKSALESKENLFLDLFGSWSLLFWGRWKIPNLLVEKQTKKIYLVDIGTAKLDDDRFLIRILVKLANRIQDSLINYYLREFI